MKKIFYLLIFLLFKFEIFAQNKLINFLENIDKKDS
jgi:hypothetical protein